MRNFIQTPISFLCAATLSVTLSIGSSAWADDSPNVLFIAIDDLNDWVGCLNGHPQAQTPNIDRLAERGTLFTNAHCAAPVCNASRNAVMLGMHPASSGFYANGESIRTRPDLLTLPKFFKDSGYTTLGAGKLFHGNNQTGPWDWSEYGPAHNAAGAKGGPFTSDEFRMDRQAPYNHVERLNLDLPLNKMPTDRITQRGNSFDWGPVPVTDSEMSDGMVAEWGIEQIERDHDAPFFLGLGFYRPHIPLYAPEKYFEDFSPDSIRLPPTMKDDLSDLPPAARDIALFPITAGMHDTVVAHDQWHGAVAAYLACVKFVDAQVGKVLDALDASLHANNTIIVLWSDHGWHLGEKDHWGKFTGWSRSTRVPLIIVPADNDQPENFSAGIRSDRPVSLVDLFPTLANLANLDAPTHLEGRSLAPLLSNPTSEWQSHALTTFGRGNYSLRTDQWRYIRYYDGTRELYNLESDPNEWHSLANASAHQTLITELDALLPQPTDIAATARYGDWKVVLPANEGKPYLFKHNEEPGPNDLNNLAAEHPEILADAQLALDSGDIQLPAAVTLIPAQPSYEWQTLFGGSENDLQRWTILPRRGRGKNSRPRAITGGWKIEGDAIVHHPSGGYLWTKEAFENFALEMDINVTPGANSGVQIWGQLDDHTNRGLEIQIFDSFTEKVSGLHSMGALYDAAAPLLNATKPAGTWQTLRIVVRAPWLAVTLNQQLILRVNLDEWNEVGRNPDGAKNKFRYALGAVPRRGHIGLQDHQDEVAFRNIRIMKLPKSE